MYSKLKQQVYEANMALPAGGLVLLTWGNVSAIDRELGVVAIKPSGVEYDKLTPEDIVVLDLQGNIVQGRLNPSSDTPTHLELYKMSRDIGAVVHTHSKWATIWAQAGVDIPAYGTTHADYFYGNIPCTRKMTKAEIVADYEKNTGLVICETIKDPSLTGGVIVANHGPFTWGADAAKAVENAVVLEYIAEMAYYNFNMNYGLTQQRMPRPLMDKHYYRKHGKDAYYGQKK